MQKWEYVTVRQSSVPLAGGIFYLIGNEKAVKYSGDDWVNLHELLNKFGERGYELIDASVSTTNTGVFQRILVLKRPKQ
jgi:hypothetical protein